MHCIKVGKMLRWEYLNNTAIIIWCVVRPTTLCLDKTLNWAPQQRLDALCWEETLSVIIVQHSKTHQDEPAQKHHCSSTYGTEATKAARHVHVPRSRLSTVHSTIHSQGHREGRVVFNRPAAQSLWASAPERGHFVDLVEHAIQPLEDEDEGRPDGLGWPVGDGEHFHDVAPQASALHGQGVIRRQLEEGVGNFC